VEKHIVTWSYWLALASAVMALLMRALNAFGMWLPPATARPGQTIFYMSFYKGALLFFLIAIGTASYTWIRQKAQ
jgi:hypothetical protein